MSQKIAIVAITRHGIMLAGKLIAALPGAKLFVPEKFRAEAEALSSHATCYAGKTGDQIPELFSAFDGIIAIFSLGAVVRLIAPHLKSKGVDPAVVVLDENGKFAIPVLSGHLGGANALAGHLATVLGATAVLTTASDARETIGVDLLGRELGWTLEATHEELVRASAAMVNDEPVALVQEAGSRFWWECHANGRKGPLPANITLFNTLEEVDPKQFSVVLWISRRKMPAPYAARLVGRCVTYRPRLQQTGRDQRMKVALGLGCDCNTPITTLRAAIDEALAVCHAALFDIAAVGSIDLKASEPALLTLAEEQNWSIRFYPAAELSKVDVPNPSETVRKHTGTPSVSAAAALLAAGTDKRDLLIEKHCHKGPDGRNATVSIARIPE